MADDRPSNHDGAPGGPRQRRWNWSAGIALGFGVGLAFGVPFIPSLGGLGVVIGLAIGAGLVPAFAMSMSRPVDADRDPRKHH